MIKWCAYCQEYQGETAPFDNFALSHSMCERCSAQGLEIPIDKFESIQLLKNLQDRLWMAGKSENRNAIDEIIDDAIISDVRPVDILVGLLAPLLYQIGEDWKQGKITVADEHRFTAFASDMLSTVRAKMEIESIVDRNKRFPVLLLNAEGNDHSLGIQVLELFLRSSGIPAKAIFPGIPVAEAINLADEIEPEWIGISISLANQIPSVIETVEKIMKSSPAIANKIFLGGHAVKNELVPSISGTIQIKELGTMLTFLHQIRPKKT
jgi:methanogenic corrinoid protein MtbC1